jgi:hydrogenase maturation protein HypF
MDTRSSVRQDTIEARRWMMGGRVQGVGYRAFVFNLARRYGLSGVVQNLGGEVRVEAQGAADTLDAFSAALISEAPPLARPHVVSCAPLAQDQWQGFTILPSAAAESAHVHVPPDSFLCEDCRGELLDPGDRRHRYPFINCTQCGPRYTLITAMPYDRPHTTMRDFPLCPACRAEYEDPTNRRFHAQPLACPQCGPQVSLAAPGEHATGEAALQACIVRLRQGETVAVKGVGGYHLMCDASNAMAVEQLRRNKHRPHKPLAVMFPWEGADGLARVRAELALDAIAETALSDPARPIVLVPKRAECRLPDEIAPGLNEIGAMLPYSPLHHLLLADFGGPLVATSGNVSGEPVLTDNTEAESRLAGVAQAFLHHDRPIARPAEDPVLRIIAGAPRLLRAGRGVAPLEFELPFAVPQPMLAVGGHMKNAVALAWDSRAVLSPHIGELGTPRGAATFEQVIADLQRLYGVRAERIACDAHPDYYSSRWAARQGLPLTRVQHHRAHASALAFEGAHEQTWLTFAWDGVGWGDDGTLWGGEAFLGRPGAWRRIASFKPFRLPGGERAAREPWRSAAALCWETGMRWETGIGWRDDDRALAVLKTAWQQGVNAPVTSSAGRLFDAAASLLGLCDHASFEGQGPMLLEAAAQGEATPLALPLREDDDGLLIADWTPLLHALRDTETPLPQRAMTFHASLARCIADIAQRVRGRAPFDRVGLTGGVFQNKILTELAARQLAVAGFETGLARRVPCNDGGLAMGQLVEAYYPHE